MNTPAALYAQATDALERAAALREEARRAGSSLVRETLRIMHDVEVAEARSLARQAAALRRDREAVAA